MCSHTGDSTWWLNTKIYCIWKCLYGNKKTQKWSEIIRASTGVNGPKNDTQKTKVYWIRKARHLKKKIGTWMCQVDHKTYTVRFEQEGECFLSRRGRKISKIVMFPNFALVRDCRMTDNTCISSGFLQLSSTVHRLAFLLLTVNILKIMPPKVVSAKFGACALGLPFLKP
jgi:hypothetical protein